MTATMIVGDIHLGKGQSIGKPGFGTALNSRIVDQITLLDWLVDTAVDNYVSTMILTGDVFEDAKPDYVFVDLLFKFLKKCELYDIEVLIVAGNHDIRRTGSHYVSILDLINSSEMTNVTLCKEVNTFIKSGVGFTLLPFRDRKSLNCESSSDAINLLRNKLYYEVAEIPPGYDRVLVGHLALEGSLPIGDEVDDHINELMCPINMFADYDYVWMGHIHRPQVRARNPYIAHIGSLDLSGFGETDHQKIVVIFDPNNSDKFKEITVPSRPLRKLTVDVPADCEDTTTFVIQEIEKLHQHKSIENALVRVEIKLSGQEAKNVERATIENYLLELGAFYVCNFSEQRKIAVLSLSKQEVDNTISPKVAVKLYSDQLKFTSEVDRAAFIAQALSVIDRFNVKQ